MSSRAPASTLAGLLLLASGLDARPPIRPAVEQQKIEFLLQELQASSETFIRNGREYTGKRAASHLARKLKFAGKRVRTARDFVIGIGSRSLDSGRPYVARSKDGKERPLSDWLFERLDRYEKEKAAPSSKPSG